MYSWAKFRFCTWLLTVIAGGFVSFFALNWGQQEMACFDPHCMAYHTFLLASGLNNELSTTVVRKRPEI